MVWERKTVITPINQTDAEKIQWYQNYVDSTKKEISELQAKVNKTKYIVQNAHSAVVSTNKQLNQYNKGLDSVERDLETIQNQLNAECNRILKGKDRVAFAVGSGKYRQHLSLEKSNRDCVYHIMKYF
ncbi:hypothetical protein [Conchiformibius steedae]|uniref:Uncharacterized protein n=1 Tax=Conchiformibius steedae TaxID=153493 RepID=A0A3P2A734_9NEIS|nr:hypothetical protein [Conchiformibius steedae]RRD89433.1 hypothetical protein EII21_08915 [Conchiformibius steedae]